MDNLKPGTYRHYKNGKLYRVLGAGKHTETDEELVVYEPLYESDVKFWIRPLAMFTEEVEYEGRKQPRFQWIEQKIR